VEPSQSIERLIEIMAALRHPETGCPWDLAQSFDSVAPYTIEEAYEVADAIDHGDMADLRDELGDLLLQVVYHARMAEEAGAFRFGDVVESITRKMIRRHPHVFGDAAADDAATVLANWETTKAAERRKKRGQGHVSLLDDVPRALPGLARAAKLQKRAATVGFDWHEAGAVVAKIREETDELEAEIDRNAPSLETVEEELGDLLFSVVNLGRHLRIDTERAMQRANNKFVRRFNEVERRLLEIGIGVDAATPAEMESAWEAAKTAERDGSG
jgi:ATP diphosphatase